MRRQPYLAQRSFLCENILHTHAVLLTARVRVYRHDTKEQGSAMAIFGVRMREGVRGRMRGEARGGPEVSRAAGKRFGLVIVLGEGEDEKITLCRKIIVRKTSGNA